MREVKLDQPISSDYIFPMIVESIRALNHAAPFVPYEIHMAGGERYLAPHPDFIPPLGVEISGLKIVAQFTVLVIRVGNQFLVSHIHDPVQIFQGDLPHDIGKLIGQFDDIETT